MPGLDRSRLVELLNQLGDEKDETALNAAREANRMVREAGEDWSDILVSDDAETESVSEATSTSYSGDGSDDLRVVERLLARKDISDTLRSDLSEFKQAIVAGKLDKMDAEYIRALSKRLGA